METKTNSLPISIFFSFFLFFSFSFFFETEKEVILNFENKDNWQEIQGRPEYAPQYPLNNLQTNHTNQLVVEYIWNKIFYCVRQLQINAKFHIPN